ncbi:MULTISPECIES: CopG family ribbon-helix-helix protein [Thalassospira]|uniref:Ribbon-helix-helix protein, CopG family n=1 Tax=Thalassospira povalilytica TaxID=732237 RepID=A0A8I1SII4_9PROT|nr:MULTISPECIES: ribbon-helix-helix protein, CopG family [Thalassospira]MBN8195431.1 ribbon-helix-helix protein, CopG family [Thalassospira povalilytica]MBO6770232.1 ribbon-helix-helix protein, CopG family [Thalassospira sp.]
MSKDTMAVRVDADLRKRLDKLAEAFGQTRSSIINDALRQYADHQEWQVNLIADRARSIAEGRATLIDHEDVLATFEQRFADKHS